MSLAAVFQSNPIPERRWSLDDMAARTIVLICGLNLNGMMTMLTGVGQTFSWVLLCAALFLLARHGTKALASHGVWVAALIGSYLAFGFLFYDSDRSFVSPIGLATAYISSLIIILAIIGYVANLQIEYQLRRYMSFVRTIFVIAALATLLSPALYAVYSQVPLSGSERMGGLFGNPNEAAIVGVLAVVFLCVYPLRSSGIQFVLVALCSASVMVTLSKTGISLLILVAITMALLRGRFWMGLLMVMFSAFAIMIQTNIREIILISVEKLGLDLNSYQLSRLLAIPEIFSGQINAATTTNRTYLWNLIMSDALERFPAGGGLGSAHFYFGGFFQNNAWQGAHNTFLMLFAEAGLIPPLLLTFIIIAVAVRLWNAGSGHRGLLVALAVLTVEMSGTHTALTTRYNNVAMASLIGVAQVLWVARRRRGAGLALHPRSRAMAIGGPGDTTS